MLSREQYGGWNPYGQPQAETLTASYASFCNRTGDAAAILLSIYKLRKLFASRLSPFWPHGIFLAISLILTAQLSVPKSFLE